MKVVEFVDALTQYVKSKIEFIRVYYSSTVRYGNYDSYSVVPLEVEYKLFNEICGYNKVTFDELVTIFEGKIPYITVFDSPRRNSRIYEQGHTYLVIDAYKYTSKAGNFYCKHSTRCTRDVRLDELEKEVAPKIKKMKEEYKKKCQEYDAQYSEVSHVSAADEPCVRRGEGEPRAQLRVSSH